MITLSSSIALEDLPPPTLTRRRAVVMPHDEGRHSAIRARITVSKPSQGSTALSSQPVCRFFFWRKYPAILPAYSWSHLLYLRNHVGGGGGVGAGHATIPPHDWNRAAPRFSRAAWPPRTPCYPRSVIRDGATAAVSRSDDRRRPAEAPCPSGKDRALRWPDGDGQVVVSTRTPRRLHDDEA